MNTFLPPVFDFAEETEENVTIYCDIDDEDVITIEDEIEEVEEVEAEIEEEKDEEEEERKEERNAACEEIATTESYYYKKAFVQQRSENNSCIFCISHAMHGMRKIGIRRNAFGKTHKWGKNMKRGENGPAHFVAFMKNMLEQVNNYYDTLMKKSYEKKVGKKREEQEQEEEEGLRSVRDILLS